MEKRTLAQVMEDVKEIDKVEITELEESVWIMFGDYEEQNYPDAIETSISVEKCADRDDVYHVWLEIENKEETLHEGFYIRVNEWEKDDGTKLCDVTDAWL